jgi:hypothetical protein
MTFFHDFFPEKTANFQHFAVFCGRPRIPYPPCRGIHAPITASANSRPSFTVASES